jgi:hypothetical protein
MTFGRVSLSSEHPYLLKPDEDRDFTGPQGLDVREVAQTASRPARGCIRLTFYTPDRHG